jgi:general secretion pathway protein A
MLDMVTPERFAATVVLMGIEDREGWVLADQGVERLALAEIGPLWTGNYRFYWHPPAGFKRALSWGDRDPAVAEVARLFARLDGQQQALAQDRFTSALRERVMLFQRSHELEDDGVVGVRTLLKLNELLDIDATAASARSRLGEEAGPVVQR